MNSQQFRCISDSDDIDFEEVAGENSPSTSKLTSADLCCPPSKRQKSSSQRVDFDSTTEEEEGDINLQANTESLTTPKRSVTSHPTESEDRSQIRKKNKKSDDTPVHGKDLRSMLTKVLEQQGEILERIKRLEKREEERETKKDEQIYVPPSVRIAVRDGYSDGVRRGFSWTFDKKNHQESENEEMSTHIIKFVKGWNANVQEKVIQCALKRYFTTKKQEAVLQQKDKLQDQKKKRVLYERKKEKAKRRAAALEELTSKGWKTEETRAQIKKILKVDFMSSDEECDDGFITHPPSWQSDTFAKLKSKLDTVYLEICSKKSRRLMQKRTIGSSHVKTLPNYPEECSWMVKND